MRNILLVHSTSRPSLVTEALYLWTLENQGPLHEIHVVTTPSGQDAVRRTLLNAPNGRSRFAQACRQLRVNRDEIVFADRTMHLMGEPQAGGDAPAAAADALFGVTRALSLGRDSRVIAVAGREDALATVLLGACLQLLGRPEDRLFCVEQHPALRDAMARGKVSDFLLPAGDMVIGRERVPARDLVRWHEIPLVLAGPPGGASDTTYMDLVRRCRRERVLRDRPEALRVNLRQKLVSVDGTDIRLTPAQFFWYAAASSLAPAPLRLAEIEEALAPHRTLDDCPAVKTMADVFDAVFPDRRGEWCAALRAACRPDPSVRSTISKINRALREALGSGSLPYLLIGGHGGTYRIALDPSRIQIN